MSRDALIVGINQYQTLPTLTAAAKDAEGIANILETYGDFRVRRLPEVIKDQHPYVGQQTPVLAQQLEQSLVNLLLPKGNHIPEAVLFYFSGHGLQREIGFREGYLAATDTQPELSNSGLSLSWLRRLIRHSPVQQIIVILDCCHSGEFLSLKDEPWQGADGQSYLFMAASREYEAAYESLGSHYSVLTDALISNLSPQHTASGKVTTTDLVAAITNQLSNELQQPLFEQGGSEIVITRQSQPDHSFSSTESLSILSRLKRYSLNFCPYRGSAPFDEKHADYYFGRDELVKQLLTSIHEHNFYALIGASGSGKTSLLKAGIMPHLASATDSGNSSNCLIRYLTPGHTPLRSLAAAFTVANQEVTVAHQLSQAEILLAQEVNGLINLVTAAMLQNPSAKKFWLIIDQFEQILQPTSDSQAQQAHQQLIANLINAIRCPSLSLGVIISLRSDTLENLLTYHELFLLVEQQHVLVTPMSYQELRDVIEKPAEKLGFLIDPYLVHHLTLDLTGAAGELALLQMTLQELWRQRTLTTKGKQHPCLTLDSYMKLGRLSSMLTRQAAATYQSLSSEEQKAAKRIFLALCDLGEGKQDQCRQARRQELFNQYYPKKLIEQTLSQLVAARLLVSDKDGTLRVTHKSLIADWPMLREWLQTERTPLRQQRDLEERAWVWSEHGERSCADYLLSQDYLKAVDLFLRSHSQELSTLAQRFVALSQRTATYQRWRTHSMAVLLPLAVITGMTASLIHKQIFPNWRLSTPRPVNSQLPSKSAKPLASALCKPALPKYFGSNGAKHLIVTSQILDFTRQTSASELSYASVAELVALMKSEYLSTTPSSLPDPTNVLTNIGEHP